ncbi:copper chaperone PCu(A)C [Gemmatimonas groenlandica]|uniref:Copper chaperone PCu(A)C n=1 Tax=Gemmatimonas groenlandica TaxID=2732249 RepID=A0A6M4IWJ0_9BACT|nr:copper chaperone PCu(A)C [Gemmatimonas groenlandica]QJR37957.1 copper chaperone PCu(A)C [Gemmatimonas groenlandica]
MMSSAVPARRSILVAVTIVAASLLGACTTRSVPPVPRVAIRHSWARIADSGATSGAYMEIDNNDTVPITLVGASSPDAGAAEVHETMQQDGMAHMMPRTELRIPAGDVVTLAPGGLHVMLVDVRRTLAVGDSLRITLRFSDSTSVVVPVPVRAP